MVGGQEADGYRPAAVDRRRPASVVLRGIELAQRLRDVVVVNLGVVLGDDAVEGGLRLVVFAVGIFVAPDMAVGHAQREVGIGVEGPQGVPLAQPLDVGRVEFVEASAVEVAQRLGSQHPADVAEHAFGVLV